MTNAEKNELYEKAIIKFGYEYQLGMVVEECAELIQACQKVFRAKAEPDKYDLSKARTNMIEEMADVDIMMEQFKRYHGMDIEMIKKLKLERLERYVNE